MENREGLISNAVAFLKNPKTQQAPIEKRIEFLQVKGLTQAEIDEALRQAGPAASAPPPPPSDAFSVPSTSFQTPYTPQYASSGVMMQPPPIPQRDWRDYFIMAVISGGVMYGMVSLAKVRATDQRRICKNSGTKPISLHSTLRIPIQKYLLPHLVPPPLPAFQQSQQDLEKQFDEVAKQLAEVAETTQSQLQLVEAQKAEVTRAVDEVDKALAEMKVGEERVDKELREIREEVANIRDMLPKLIQSSQATATTTLADLQQELKSLKALLLSRGPSFPGPSTPTSSSTYNTSTYLGSNYPSTPGPVSNSPFLNSRPSIPAWQLASSSSPSSQKTKSPQTSPKSGNDNLTTSGQITDSPTEESGNTAA
ncbi:peroxisomal membrane protein pex14 [Tulasnella sp. 418]|nr:peroxisomal membrane protein pex14 [Tulasnella sp. 418]